MTTYLYTLYTYGSLSLSLPLSKKEETKNEESKV
jgi:hypothetical protein